MINIDYKNNITISTGDDAIIDVNTCPDKLITGDYVLFHSPEQEVKIIDFHDGICKIYIEKSDEAIEGKYCIKVVKEDGRTSTIANGKFIRKDCE